jgi:type III restriction enzyme
VLALARELGIGNARIKAELDAAGVVRRRPDRDLNSNDVRAKRDAAQRWAAYANDGLPAGSPRWSYLLVSETDLREAKEDWAALRKLAQ